MAYLYFVENAQQLRTLSNETPTRVGWQCLLKPQNTCENYDSSLNELNKLVKNLQNQIVNLLQQDGQFLISNKESNIFFIFNATNQTEIKNIINLIMTHK